MIDTSAISFPCRFMAIDNGSNAIKYRLWQISGPGQTEQIAERRFPVRIGEGVFGSGRIAPEKIAEAVSCYAEILRDMERLGATAHRAVGTSALREATNARELIDAVEAGSGIHIEVIEDREEARLIALGAIGRPESLTGRHVLIDIGGGSSEIIVTRDSQIDWARSLPIGAVRLTNQFFASLPPTTDQYARAAASIRETLDRELATLPASNPGETTRALGSGGTLTALLLMVHQLATPADLAEDPARRHLERTELEATENALRTMTKEEIVATWHADPRRAEILLAGALILSLVFDRLGLDAIDLGRGGVGDGLLWDWLGRQSK